MYHWSTDAYPEDDAYDVWCSELQDSTIPWSIGKCKPPRFSASYSGKAIAGLNVMESHLASFSGHRGKQEITRSEGSYCSIQFMKAGYESVNRDGHQTVLRRGDAYLWCSEENFSFTAHKKLHTISLRIPSDLLAGQVESKNRTPRKLDYTKGIGALLFQTIHSTYLTDDEFNLAESDLLESTILSLVTSAFSLQISDKRMMSTRERTFERIKEYIEMHTEDPSLSVTSTAASLGISKRYLHTLFADNSMTFMGYVQHRRIELIKEDLLVSKPSETLTSISYKYGFSEPSQLSRVFRKLTGMTPSEFKTGGSTYPRVSSCP
ncbi:helix-turn-helix domain-containing protein [Halocynthiibacter namhaensis]|uniref:helix-turn-helix domain-containing protein n=1 Tax=Halocynthiibacter namhaensis TaxID=1290553 RepID=UPI0009DEDB41|nr:helix-turn-helix domain-containing protein [Halocynthiibacter namhaensis]